MELASELFAALQGGKETKIPMYDKSAHDGKAIEFPSHCGRRRMVLAILGSKL